MYSSKPVDRAAQWCAASLVEAGLTVSATVRESEAAIDLALLEPRHAPTIIRCVEKVTREDVQALRVMLTEGDFTRAAIVYTAQDQPHLSGEIESYSLSRIDELVASLARESAK